MRMSIAAAMLLTISSCTPVHPQVHADFVDGLKHGTSITVFPAAVRTGSSVAYDQEAARRITRHLDGAGIVARVDDDRISVGAWHVNEARMARESAGALAAHLAVSPAATRYALLPEYVTASRNVAAVHAYVVRDDGVLAAMLVLNSHSDLFASAKPSGADDCTALVIEAIDQEWIAQ